MLNFYSDFEVLKPPFKLQKCLLFPNQDLEDEEQVLPKILLEEPFSPMNRPEENPFNSNQQRRVQNILEHELQKVTLKGSLSLILDEYRERRFFITIPSKTLRVAINVRVYPYTLIHRYAVLMIPTLTEADIPMVKGSSHPMRTHMAMSLKQVGSSTIQVDAKMKMLLWNCRGCNNPDFKRIFREIVEWKNPSIICLTETGMQDHQQIRELVNFSDLLEIGADRYSGGVVLMWKSEELTIDPITITDQQIHVNTKILTASTGEAPSQAHIEEKATE